MELERQYTYTLRCYHYMSELIRLSLDVRRQTPVQIEQVKTWRRVRRALAHDLEQMVQRLPDGRHMMLVSASEDEKAASAYFATQITRFAEAGYKNPLNERVELLSTLSQQVS